MEFPTHADPDMGADSPRPAFNLRGLPFVAHRVPDFMDGCVLEVGEIPASPRGKRELPPRLPEGDRNAATGAGD